MATTRAEYFACWSAVHGGYDPATSRVLAGWLAGVHACSRPFVAVGVPPAALTATGVALSGAAATLSGRGAGALLAAAALVALSGLVDSLDGAVALLTGRAGAAGYVLDSVADRCSDLLYLVALLRAGAQPWTCVAGGTLMFMHEYVRARAGAAGMADIGVVTVGERPTRVAVTAVALLAAAAFAHPWSGTAQVASRWAVAGAWVWVALTAAGLAQLTVVVARWLAAARPPAG